MFSATNTPSAKTVAEPTNRNSIPGVKSRFVKHQLKQVTQHHLTPLLKTQNTCSETKHKTSHVFSKLPTQTSKVAKKN